MLYEDLRMVRGGEILTRRAFQEQDMLIMVRSHQLFVPIAQVEHPESRIDHRAP
jgi:hypothetical protein